ncbi:OTU protein [Neophaeococcomyces mojaviensis]|uniref:OTU protein n=1 Tax=Neophaeococcomyces mojaviensis TaxID=3383035 RepID=A0ACC3ABT3_9EURO|nr:OTU protein [Knufia sp. JES_112]
MEELQARHRKEQKELQSKITSKKKNATKKTRKGVNDECERLEQELKDRQEAEISALTTTDLDDEASKLALDDRHEEAEAKASMNQDELNRAGDTADDGVHFVQHNNETTMSQGKAKKPNRQKARLARRAAEQDAQIEAAAQQAANMPDQRQQELSAMKAETEKRGLTEILIRPDGHCMYSACSETIGADSAKSYNEVRIATADYINQHGDDFMPFLEEPLETYTRKIKDTAEWGGHLELQAIAKAFKTSINVLQASGRVDRIEPESKTNNEIWLAYYKHSFGLGEHYNALKKVAA